MRMVIAAASFVVISSTATAAPQESAARQAGQVARQICDVKLPPLEDQYDLPDPNVPPRVRELLPQFRDALRGYLLDLLNSRSMRNRSAAQVQARAARELRAAGVTVGTVPARPSCYYGELRAIKLETVPEHPNLLVAVITLEIPCGTDSSLAIFEKTRSGWRLVLADEAEPYQEVNGGYDAFGYKISPPDKDGRWFVVAANMRPWCTSCWNSLDYRVLRPASSLETPDTMYKQTISTYRCHDEVFRITPRSDGFQMSMLRSRALYADDFWMERTARFRVTTDRAERVGPMASEPDLFLDEWVSMSWDEASRWSQPGAGPQLQNWHATLREDRWEFGVSSYQDCDMAAGEIQTWVVTLENMPDKESNPKSLYVLITNEDKDFRVQSIGTDRPTSCRGKIHPPSPVRYKVR